MVEGLNQNLLPNLTQTKPDMLIWLQIDFFISAAAVISYNLHFP